MNINRINYEEYFLLYIDNELDATGRKEVEDFVQLHPDLEEELTMLKQSQLKPDAALLLEDKSALFKSEKDYLVNLQNYESFFLLYVDNELNESQRKAVEDFVTANPSLQQELEILLRTKVSADVSIIYTDRQLLYRQEGSEKVVSFKIWRSIAIAAMLLIATGIFWLNNRTNPVQQPIAKNNQSTVPKKNSNEIVKEKENSKVNESIEAQSNSTLVAGTPYNQKTTSQAKNVQNESKKANKEQTEKPDQIQIADRHVPDQIDDPNIPAASITKVDIEVPTAGSASVSDKYLIVDQAYGQPQADKNMQLTSDDREPDEPAQSKNKLRGLFRQVSRVVEKTTHVPGGENKKLRIGNIQIALK